MGSHSRVQRGRRGREAGPSTPWGPTQRPLCLAVGHSGSKGSRAARKMPASCEGLINLLSPEVTAWWGAGVSIFWYNYLGSEGSGLRRCAAALCVVGSTCTVCLCVRLVLNCMSVCHILLGEDVWYVYAPFSGPSLCPRVPVSLQFRLAHIRACYV